MNSRLHQLAAIASAAVLALSVSACSSDDDKKADPDKSATPSATASSKEETAAPTAEQLAVFTGISAAQAKAKTAHVVMTLGAAAQQIKATAQLKIGKQAEKSALAADVAMAGNKDYSLSMIMLERALFVNLGQITGNKYGEINLDDKKDEQVAIQFTPLAQQLDPNQQLTRLSGALKSAKEKGEPQEIDGVQTQPYEVVLDAKKIPGNENQPKDAPKTVTYTLYVGPDQLLRRVTTGSKDSAVQADYTKWGEPVKIKAPKSSQVSPTALDALRGGGS